MATDIKAKFTDYLDADFILGNGDLEREQGLETAVLMSLFTDRRADDADEYDNNDKRGCWIDNLPEIEGDQIGSKIWLLYRSKTTQENEIKLKAYIYEALEWMIDDNIVRDIEITVYTHGNPENKRVSFIVQLFKFDGNNIAYKFDDLWNYTSVINVGA